MKLKTLLSIASVYMLLVGLGFILMPQIFGTGAVPINPSPALIAYLRLLGSPLLGIAVMDWMAKNEPPSRARDAIIIGNTVGFAVIAGLDVWGLFHGARPATKAFVVIHLAFTLAFIMIGRKNSLTKTG
jgi:hypothetical protein